MKSIKDEILKYAELQIRYYKFEAVEKIGEIRAQLIFKLFLMFMLFAFLMFLGLTLAFYLGEIFDNYFKGFGIVAILFMLLTGTIYVFRNRIIDFIFKDYINKNIPS